MYNGYPKGEKYAEYGPSIPERHRLLITLHPTGFLIMLQNEALKLNKDYSLNF